MKKLDQKGFHIIETIIVIAVLGVIGFVGYKVFNKSFQKNSTTTNSSSQGTYLNKSDENGLVDAQQLECVPRGHDYYRTNSTLAVDPKDANTVYVGVEYKGIYKSTDGGATWVKTDKGVRGYPKESDKSQKCIQELGRTIIDPKDNTHVLMSRVESPGDLGTLFSENAGIWESKNSGATWRQLLTSKMNASGSRAIAFDPNNSSTIYYGSNNMHPSFTDSSGKAANTKYFNKEGILYKTTNSGSNWKELPTGAFPGLRAVNISVDSSDPQKIWLFTFTSGEDTPEVPENKQNGPMLTTDGGKTWTSMANKLPSGYKTLTEGIVSPKNSSNAYVITMSRSSSPKSFYTKDNGATWQASSTYTESAAFDPTDASGQRLLGYAPYGPTPAIVESTDGGATWSTLSNVPTGVDGKSNFGVRISGFAWAASNPKIVYVSGSGAYVWKSTDGGKTWSTVMDLTKIGGPNKNAQGNTQSREQDH